MLVPPLAPAQAMHFPWAEVDWSLPLDRSDGLEGKRWVHSDSRAMADQQKLDILNISESLLDSLPRGSEKVDNTFAGLTVLQLG